MGSHSAGRDYMVNVHERVRPTVQDRADCRFGYQGCMCPGDELHNQIWGVESSPTGTNSCGLLKMLACLSCSRAEWTRGSWY